MTLMPTSMPRPSLPTLLAIAIVCAWLAALVSIVNMSRPPAAGNQPELAGVLPRLHHSLQLPYFSFARALRPGS